MSAEKLLIPFFTAGYPGLDSLADLLVCCDGLQIPYIEVGLPHSDALADGPVIQNSSHHSLTAGMNIELLFQQVEALPKLQYSKLILFSYYNPLLVYGLERSLQEWKGAGGFAVLVPDLPLEESHKLLAMCQEHDLKLIFLVAPTTTPERLARIVSVSEEFIYLVSATGVTGTTDLKTGQQQTFADSLASLIGEIKKQRADMRVVIGFGIGDSKKAREALDLGADGVVIGSTIIKLLGEKLSGETGSHPGKLQVESLQALRSFLQSIQGVL